MESVDPKEEWVDVWDGTDYDEDEPHTPSPPPRAKKLFSFLKSSPGEQKTQGGPRQRLEKKIALRFERFVWYQLLHKITLGLFIGQVVLATQVISHALWRSIIPPLGILALTFLLSMLMTILKKYEIDITSVLNQEFEEIEKIKLQQKAIDQLFLCLGLGNFIFISSLFQMALQKPVDHLLLVNQFLNSSDDAVITSQTALALWGNPWVSHLTYLIPGIIIAFFTYYGRYYEIYLKWKEFYKRWAKGTWFDNPNFTAMLLGKRQDFEPYIFVGTNQETGAEMWIDPVARMNNLLGQGPIGVGKSQALFRPFIYQDLVYFFRYIREFVKDRKKYKDDQKFEKKFFNKKRAGKMLNGFMVIEPSSDLVNAIYEDLIKIGFPKEMITYINPDDPETAGINVFVGPVDKVVSMVTKIIGDLSKSSNAFFDNTQRTYLKKMVYLLKLSYMIPNQLDKDLVGGAPTFKAFNDLKYNNILWQRKEILGVYVQALEKKMAQFSKLQKLTAAYRDFTYKYWIAKDVYDYWDNNLTQKDDVILNAKQEHVQGLLTVIDDIASNIYISRVFFQDSDFNFDVLLKYGGILLINTDVKNLGGDVGTFAKFISLAAEQASFRRTPYAHPMFPYYEDEHPEYVTDNTPVFTSQNRKYQTPGHYACQSRSQYSEKNPEFADSFFTNLRNRIVFQGCLPADLEFYEKLFGSKDVISASYTEADFDLIEQNEKMNRIPERPEQIPNISQSDLYTLPQFNLAMGTTNGSGEVIQFAKVKATPAFKMTDSLPKANVDEIKIWFAEYQKQLVHYNKNAKDMFALGEDAKKVISEIQEENRKEQMAQAPASVFAREFVKEDMEQAKQAQTSNEALESSKDSIDQLEQLAKEEQLSLKSLHLNAMTQD